MPSFRSAMADRPDRPDPFAIAFGPLVPDRFGAVRVALGEAAVDAFDRDAWTLSRAGAELLHELRPEEGLGEGMAELVALTHAGFLFWDQGERLLELSRSALDALIEEPRTAEPPAVGRSAYYVRLPGRRVWGEPVIGAPAEPLDGWFVVANDGWLSLTAIFGLLPGRPGFTVAHVAGSPPGPLARADGSALFLPVLPGGQAAGLWSLVGQEELLELGWRIHYRILAAGGPAPGEREASP